MDGGTLGSRITYGKRSFAVGASLGESQVVDMDLIAMLAFGAGTNQKWL
jgi:hypothetical protein